MRTHQEIDGRSLALAQAVVDAIDRDPLRRGIEVARQTCRRWLDGDPSHAAKEWIPIVEREWQDIRRVLLDDSEEGRRLRQNSPFCGVFSPRERWLIYERFRREPKVQFVR
jgi:hypothetical protein